MLRKALTIIAVIAVILFFSVTIFLRYVGDPNYLLRKSSVPVTENKSVEVYERYNRMLPFSRSSRVFEFTPSETAEYEFTISDISCDEDVSLSMIIMDEGMSEYTGVTDMVQDGRGDEEDEEGTYRARAFLQKKNICYIGIDAASSEHSGHYYWGCKLTVSRVPEEEKPAEITVDQTVRVTVKADERSSVLFIPEETGYYKFDAEVTGSKSGYAGIESITTDNNRETPVSDGLCCLEQGIEYYVWVSAYDIAGKSAKVDVTCRGTASAEFGPDSTAPVIGDTVIEYTADTDGPVIIYSESEGDGDPSVWVYDADGFPMRNDDDTGAEISGNAKDFAVILDVSKGDVYRIFVTGKFSECSVIKARYTGDGSSVTEEDIEPFEITETDVSGSGEADDAAAQEEDGNADNTETP